MEPMRNDAIIFYTFSSTCHFPGEFITRKQSQNPPGGWLPESTFCRRSHLWRVYDCSGSLNVMGGLWINKSLWASVLYIWTTWEKITQRKPVVPGRGCGLMPKWCCTIWACCTMLYHVFGAKSLILCAESGSQILLYNIYHIQFIPPFIPTNFRSRNWNILLYLFVKWLNQNFNIKWYFFK